MRQTYICVFLTHSLFGHSSSGLLSDTLEPTYATKLNLFRWHRVVINKLLLKHWLKIFAGLVDSVLMSCLFFIFVVYVIFRNIQSLDLKNLVNYNLQVKNIRHAEFTSLFDSHSTSHKSSVLPRALIDSDVLMIRF